MAVKKQIIITSSLLLFSIIFFGLSDFDIYVQDIFYDTDTQSWILDRNLQPWKFIFYDGIKKLIIAVGVMFLLVLVFFSRSRIIKEYRQGMVIVVLSAILIPAFAGFLKKNTNMPCPKHEIHYNGEMIRTAVWERYPQPYKQMKKLACWPAGHASGGFALLSLFFLFKTKRNRILALSSALVIGWSMGIYKMLIGDHFLSHTVITMLIAWLFILIIKTSTTRWFKN